MVTENIFMVAYVGQGLIESGNERTFKCDGNVLYLDLEWQKYSVYVHENSLSCTFKMAAFHYVYTL